MTKAFESLIVVEENGTKKLTDFGQFIKDFVIIAMQELLVLVENVRDMFLKFGKEADGAAGLLHMFTLPLNIIVNLLKLLGPGFIQVIMLYKVMNAIMPMNIANTYRMIMAEKAELISKRAKLTAQLMEIKGIGKIRAAKIIEEMGYKNVTQAMWGQVAAQAAMHIGMFAIIGAVRKWGMDSHGAAAGVGALASMVAYLAYAITAARIAGKSFANPADWFTFGGAGVTATIAGVASVGAAIGLATRSMSNSTEIGPAPSYSAEGGQEFATGGRVMYPRTSFATGGRTGGTGGTHFPVMVEAGESIISKTQNMANGGVGGGVTIQIHGDVYDGDNFAEKVGQALPNAIRRVNDIGGI
jgi:hypothetical protein